MLTADKNGWQTPPRLPPKASRRVRQLGSRGSMRLHDELFHRTQVGLRHLVEKVAIVAVFTAGCESPLISAWSNDCRFAVVSVVAVRHQAPVGGFSPAAVGERPEVEAENRMVAVGGLRAVQHAEVAVVVQAARFLCGIVGAPAGITMPVGIR